MLEKLELRKFQLHKKLNIEFSPTVTTIIGRSYSGKSAIIRGLVWPMRNTPSGTSIINWDKENQKAISRLYFDNGNKLARLRSNSENKYILNGKSFTAFRDTVPKEIADLINISDINIQRQITMPFWFNETAGEVSRQLNKIVNLDVIDRTLSNIESKHKLTKQEIEITKKRLEAAREQKNNLSYIIQMDEDLQKLEGLDRKHQKIIERIEQLQSLIERIKILKEQASVKIPSIMPLKKIKEKWDDVCKKVNRLESLIKTAEEKEEELCQRKNTLNQLRTTFSNMVDSMHSVCPLLGGNCPRGLKKTS